MILADDLFLLLHDERGRPLGPRDSINVALAGAVLVDLAEARRIDVGGRSGPTGRSRVSVLPAPPTGDEILDGAMRMVAKKQGKRATSVITALTPHLQDTVGARLVRAGVVEQRTEKMLGLFPVRRWPARDAAAVAGLRRRLRQVLASDVRTEERLRALVALLQAGGSLKKAVTLDGDVADWSAAKKRAKAMAKAQWSAQAVSAVIAATESAAAAAGSAAVVAATASVS